MSKRKGEAEDDTSRNVKSKHDRMSTASTKEGDLRDHTELKHQNPMDRTRSQHTDKKAVLSRSASDSLTMYKRGLEKMEVAKKNRNIVKVKKALKQKLKAAEDENEEVKGSLYTLTMRCNELKEQLENAKKMEQKQQHRIQRLEKEAAEGEEKHTSELMDFTLKKRIEELEAAENRLKFAAAYQKQCRVDAEEDLEEAKKKIASQQMDIENFHAVARAEVEKLKAVNTKISDLNGTFMKERMEHDAHVEKLKQELEITKVEVEEWKMVGMSSAEDRMQLENEMDGFDELYEDLKDENKKLKAESIKAKEALHKQLQQTEAQLVQARNEVTEAQQQRDKFKTLALDRGVASFPSTVHTVVPGAFIRLKGINAEGKKELWYALVDKVNPADRSITVGRYYKRAYELSGSFLMAPCKATDGLPLKGEWLDINAFQVINHFPVCDVSYNHSMKKACERAGWGPFDNCDQHSAEQHARQH